MFPSTCSGCERGVQNVCMPHRFCKSCGMPPFYTPRSHPDQVDVNIRCLDGYAWRRFAIRPFDGQNWEASVGQIR